MEKEIQAPIMHQNSEKQVIDITVRGCLKDDGKHKKNDAITKYLNTNFSDWKSPDFYMIPEAFSARKFVTSGHLAEKKIYDLLYSLKKQFLKCVIINGLKFKKQNQVVGEADFIFLSPQYKIIIFEVKATSNLKTRYEYVQKATKQIETVIRCLKDELKKFHPDNELSDLQIIGCIMFPNMFLHEDVPVSDYVYNPKVKDKPSQLFIAYNHNCVNQDKFVKWFKSGPLVKDENISHIYEITAIAIVGKRFEESKVNRMVVGTAKAVVNKCQDDKILVSPSQSLCLEDETDLLFIFGVAGSGKSTILKLKVMQVLHNPSITGNILVLCFSFNLKKYFSNIFLQFENVDVFTSDELWKNSYSTDKKYQTRRYRHVFIDEAEDFDRETLDKMYSLRERYDPPCYLWYFIDRNQSDSKTESYFRFHRQRPDLKSNIRYLQTVLRSPSNIFDYVMRNFNDDTWSFSEKINLGHNVFGPVVESFEITQESSTEAIAETVAKIIYQNVLSVLFVKNGEWHHSNQRLSASDVLILTFYENDVLALMKSLTELCHEKLAVKLLRECDTLEVEHSIKLETARKAKGIDSTVVICVLPFSSNAPDITDFYIAASRSYGKLYVIGSRKQFFLLNILKDANTFRPERNIWENKQQSSNENNFDTFSMFGNALTNILQTDLKPLFNTLQNDRKFAQAWLDKFPIDVIHKIAYEKYSIPHVRFREIPRLVDDIYFVFSEASKILFSTILIDFIHRKEDHSNSELFQTLVVCEDDHDVKHLKDIFEPPSLSSISVTIENIEKFRFSNLEFQIVCYMLPFSDHVPKLVIEHLNSLKSYTKVIYFGSDAQINFIRGELSRAFKCTAEFCSLLPYGGKISEPCMHAVDLAEDKRSLPTISNLEGILERFRIPDKAQVQMTSDCLFSENIQNMKYMDEPLD